jgi:CAAX protease family protein
MSVPPLPPQPPAAEDRGPVAPVWHTVVFIVVTLGLTFVQARQTPKVSSMYLVTRLPLYAVMILFELVLFAYVWLLGLRPAGKTLRDVIGGKWNTWADFGMDVAIAFGFWAAVFGMLIAMHVLLGQNNQQMEAAKILIPRTYGEMAAWVVLSVTAGFCEELIFRGYLQRQFLALTGKVESAVVLQALVFGAAHLYQGWKGAVTIGVYGALFGILAAWRKSLRPGMIQHAAQDTFSGMVGSFALRHHMF